MPIPAVLPVLAKALPWIASGLFAGGTLWSAHNQAQSNELMRRGLAEQQEYNRRQTADYERWLSDYKKNTGVNVRYKYLGTSGALETNRLNADLMRNQMDVYGYNNRNIYANLMRSGGAISGFAHSFRSNRWSEPRVQFGSRRPDYIR